LNQTSGMDIARCKWALNNVYADLDLEEFHLGPKLAVDYGVRHACLAHMPHTLVHCQVGTQMNLLVEVCIFII
jgi:hypothetical protein